MSPEAQFTPKQVETNSERDKLMFRVKIQVPEELVASYIERIKTGVRGVGYVKYDESAVWPDWLQNLMMTPCQDQRIPTPKRAPNENGSDADTAAHSTTESKNADKKPQPETS